MFNWFRRAALQLAKVPPEPHAPAGAPGSVRVFRAAPAYQVIRYIVWGVAQVATLAGIIVSVVMIHRFEERWYALREHVQHNSSAAVAASESTESRAGNEHKPHSRDGDLSKLARRAPWWSLPLFKLIEGAAIVIFIMQLPLTLAAVRLDWEMRWYIVTDRSLRIRSGIWQLQEATMSFANIQKVGVSQGPLERLLGISDLEVESAGGGGGGSKHQQHAEDSMHQGVFKGVGNAEEIKNLILARLKAFRAAGLGDRDDHQSKTVIEPARLASGVDAATLIAARDVLAEVRAWRADRVR